MPHIKAVTATLWVLQVVTATRIQSSTPSKDGAVSVMPLLRRSDPRLGARRHGMFGNLGDVGAVSVAWAPSEQGTELSRHQIEELQQHRKSRNRLGAKDRQHTRHFGLNRDSFGFGVAAKQSGSFRNKRGLSRLEDVSGSEYVGVIGVGTKACDASGNDSRERPKTCPEQPVVELRVVFDTGSADLFVFSDLCTIVTCPLRDRRTFNHTMSTTFRESAHPEIFDADYNSGWLEGRLGADNVRIGSIVVHEQQFGLISEAHGQAFHTMTIEGIVGLGFSKLSVKTRPLLDTLANDKSMIKPEFAFFLHRDPSKGGAVLWGEGSEHLGLHAGDVRWFPVVQEEWWSVSLVGFRLGNRSGEMISLAGPENPYKPRQPANGALSMLSMAGEAGNLPMNNLLVVDTGSTYFMFPPRLYKAISQEIQLTECKHIDALPTMIFTVRTDTANQSSVEDLAVPPEVYMVRSSDDVWCYPGIMSMGYQDTPPIVIIGEVFMRHYFSIFRRGETPGNSWIGFAPAKSGPEAERKLLQLQEQQ